MKQLTAVVDRLERQGKDNLSITLIAADEFNLPEWQAGDHIDLYLPNQIIRQYSLTGNPNNQNEYLICVKKELASRGGSQFIHDELRIGQTLKISTPRNAFRLVQAKHYILMAAGIGITPLLAFAEHLENQRKSFDLFYYVKDLNDTAFSKRLKQGFKYGNCHILCSHQGQSIRHGLPKICHSPQIDTHIYLCGPEGFMHFCRQSCLENGWPSDHLHFEAFAPTKIDTTHKPLNQTTFQVQLRSNGRIYDIPEDKSIAQVLIDHEISVPLSCEMGMCGACLTRVYQGDIDHQDTVQTEEEKQANNQFIALCCSRAKSPILEIDL